MYGRVIQWIVAGLLLIGIPGIGRAAYIRHYNARSWLHAAHVFHVNRDSKGFLWFCTDNGLMRYDGANIRRYSTRNGLADNEVYNIYEDSSGRIWPFSYNGKYCFIKNDAVFNEDNDPVLRQLPHCGSFITCVVEGPGHSRMIVFYSGAVATTGPGGWSWLVPSLAKEGVHWPQLMTPGSFQMFTARGHSFLAADRSYYKPALDRMQMTDTGDYRVTSDAQGVSWQLGTQRADTINSPALSKFTLLSPYISADRNYLLCGTSHGLELIRLADKRRTQLLEGEVITGCLQDRTGNYWITTLDKGIYLLHRELEAIRKLDARTDAAMVTGDGSTLAFVSGLRLYGISQTATGAPEELLPRFQPYNRLLAVTPGAVLYNDAWHGQLLLYDRRRRKTAVVAGQVKQAFTAGDTCFAHAGAGGAFLKVSGNRIIWQQSVRLRYRIRASCQPPGSRHIYLTDGHFLYRYSYARQSPDTLLASPLLADVTDMHSVGAHLVMAANNSYVYIADTAATGRGLQKIRTSLVISSVDALPGDRLLVRTDVGDMVLDLADGRWQLRPVSYPIINAGYEVLLPFQGKLAALSHQQLYLFDAALLNARTTAPQLFLQQVRINGQVFQSSRITVHNARHLDVSISIGALTFGDELKAIDYRLSGAANDAWQTTAAATINLVLERSGTYELAVCPAGDHSHPLQLIIQANPPFTRTWLFYLLIVAAVILLCSYMVYRIHAFRQKQFQREYDYLKSEHKAMHALLNPHFLFNAINNIQGLINMSRKHEAADYLATLSRLVRQNLENLQDHLISFENELALIERYVRLQNMRFQNRIHLHVDTSRYPVQELFLPPLLLHTFVENAIVHGYKNRKEDFNIRIHIIAEQTDYIRITITDDGVGLTAQKDPVHLAGKKSMGIPFNETRLERMNRFYRLRQSIRVEERADAPGTQVTILLYGRLKACFSDKQVSAGSY